MPLMTAPIPLGLCRRQDLSQGAKVAYARLALEAESAAGDTWFEGIAWLAAEVGVGVDQAQKYVRELKARHLIRTHPQGQGRPMVVHLLPGSAPSERHAA